MVLLQDSTMISDATRSLIDYGAIGALLVLSIAGGVILLRFILNKLTKNITSLSAHAAETNIHLKDIADDLSEIKNDFKRMEDRLIDHERRISHLEGRS